jgi:hypothetical protein
LWQVAVAVQLELALVAVEQAGFARVQRFV